MAQLMQRTYVTDPRVGGLESTEITTAEHTLGIALPVGYATWMETWGPGEFEHFVSLRAPEDLLRGGIDATSQLQGRGFFENHAANTGKDALVIASSHDGDQLLCLPRLPGRLFYVPRHENQVIECRNDLVSGLTTMIAKTDGILPPRPVFVPEQPNFERQFMVPRTPQRFERVCAALCERLAHDYLHEIQEDDYQAFHLYSRRFFGWVICHQDEDYVQVAIEGPAYQIDHLAPILNCLKATGLMDEPVPPTPTEQAEHARIVYVTHNYHYLVSGRYRDISLSREQPSASQKQLYAALMRDFSDRIVFNPCPVCDKQRRTPRARQCLNCGART